MPASSLDSALQSARALINSLLHVLRELKPLPGLSETDRLGMGVLTEQLSETLGLLNGCGALSATQAEHLRQAVETLGAAAHALVPSPPPAQVAAWRVGLEPAVRRMGKVVLELPHR